MDVNDPWLMEAGDPGPEPRKRIDGTPQQEAFWAELLGGSDHLLLEARAGTGKSTSCREGMHRLLEGDPKLVIRYCCFNTKVAAEFEAKCPRGVEVGTMHRFGNLALKTAFNSQLDKFKTYNVLDALEGGANLKRYIRKSVATLVSLAKNHGLRPDDPALRRRLDEFVFHYDVETWRQQPAVVSWAVKVLGRSAEMTSIIDFDDMLWLPVLHEVRFPGTDFLFIDEVQDTNPVQHELAGLMAGAGRTIVVGDPFQAIYGFRGADTDSIPNLRDRLNAKVMPLTVTFRCPRSHVDLARELVADFEAAPEAPEGELVHASPEAVDNAEPGDMVLCRANAPIVSACLKAVSRRTPAIVRGRAIGDSLTAIVRKLNDPPTIRDFVRELMAWKAREVDRLDARDGADDLIEQVGDRVACLDAIASSCNTPAEIPGVISDLFSDDDAANRITFSSVHRAKGSEARRVTYIQVPYGEKRDKLRPPQPWELQQRKNLRYVALTRSLHWLTLVA
jgi:superfamily I DNA/RNA helicase